MRISRPKALKILEEEASSNEPTPPDWDQLVGDLSYEVNQGANKTFIAMLGTSLLARATDIRADPFALKSGSNSPGAYSARGLCQHVLAAHAPKLGIDLGVTGREPLNNQPFFAEDRVHRGLPVHPRAAEGFRILLEGLNRISSIESTADARAALRSFIRGRKEQRYEGNLQVDEKITLRELFDLLNSFIVDNSEFGRRAQSVAAGLLDTAALGEVIVTKIHDPDRHFAGDVTVVKDAMTVLAFEVRDKPVSEPDVYHFVNKVANLGGRNAAVVAASPNQSVLSITAVCEFAADKGVALTIFYSWDELFMSSSFWGTTNAEDAAARALKSVHARALELEVSEEGIRLLETPNAGTRR